MPAGKPQRRAAAVATQISMDIPFGEHAYSANFSQSSGSPVDIFATGLLSSGATADIDVRGAPVYQALTDAVVQFDQVQLADTYIDSDSPTLNHGANIRLRVNSGSLARRSLLRFELGAIPKGAKLVSAVLELRSLEIDDGDGGQISVHRMTSGWIEGTQTAATTTGASWNEREDGEPGQCPAGISTRRQLPRQL